MIEFSTITEIGCASNSDCPSQRACVNTLCINPCSQGNLCQHDQECHVENHNPVCVQGMFSVVALAILKIQSEFSEEFVPLVSEWMFGHSQYFFAFQYNVTMRANIVHQVCHAIH